jgi:hypothetical protein
MDPYIEVCKRFADDGVRYVIVGVFGINFYARQAGQIITTADCDILVPADFPVFRKALQLLAAMDSPCKPAANLCRILTPLS